MTRVRKALLFVLLIVALTILVSAVDGLVSDWIALWNEEPLIDATHR